MSIDAGPPAIDLQVRPPLPQERAAVMETIRATDLLPAEGIQQVEARFDAFLSGATGDACWLAVYLDGAVAGVAFSVREPITDGTWNLLMLAVHPQHQDRGLGTALVHGVEDRLRTRGVRLLIIETSGLPSYAGQRRFYARLGYAQPARIPDFYESGEDKVIFTKVVAGG